MKVRLARPDEAETLSELALRSKAHWGYSQGFIEACRTELSYGASQIESPRWSFLVAEEANVIIGFYALEQVSEQEAELAALFVCPEWIGKGIGRALLSDAKYRARQGGSSVLTIQSDPYAAQFYQIMGAQPTGTRQSDSIPGRYLPTFAISLQMTGTSSTKTTRLVRAPRERIYGAFLDPVALEAWMVPRGMTGKVHAFSGEVGGGYEMSLFYSIEGEPSQGKSTENEDRYKARFVELKPPSEIVETIVFDSDDPSYSGEMIMTVHLEDRGDETMVTILFDQIPPGIRPEDNDAGTRSSLEKLAQYVE